MAFLLEVDSLPRPSTSNPLSSPSHSAVHSGLAPAIEATQSKVGKDGSDDPSSHHFKISALEEAIENIDVEVSLEDVEGLQEALDGKSDAGHTHDDRYFTETEATALLDGKADESHAHAIDDLTGLGEVLEQVTENLSGKAPLVHSHAISDVTGLQTALNGKAASSHTHAIADVTNLQSTLDTLQQFHFCLMGA